jgi:hypothetical protein
LDWITCLGGLINSILLQFHLDCLFWYMVLFGQLLPLKICVFRLMTLSVFIDLHQVVVFVLTFTVSLTA